jgi:hypothetical protein
MLGYGEKEYIFVYVIRACKIPVSRTCYVGEGVSILYDALQIVLLCGNVLLIPYTYALFIQKINFKYQNIKKKCTHVHTKFREKCIFP